MTFDVNYRKLPTELLWPKRRHSLEPANLFVEDLLMFNNQFLVLLLISSAVPQINQNINENITPSAPPKMKIITSVLFKKLAGKWLCNGAFADKRPLSAVIEYTLSEDNQRLRYRHTDNPPTSFKMDAQWAVDTQSELLASLAFSSVNDRGNTSSLYVATDQNDESVTLEQKTLLNPPFKPNRFIYTVNGNDLRMVWQVQRNGVDWVLGDYLDCKKASEARH